MNQDDQPLCELEMLVVLGLSSAGWDETLNGPSPDVWTPAASTWVSLLQSDLTAKDRPNIVPATSESVTSTPLVLAMPEPMAKALGWPDAPIGWADVLALATDPLGLKPWPPAGRFVTAARGAGLHVPGRRLADKIRRCDPVPTPTAS